MLIVKYFLKMIYIILIILKNKSYAKQILLVETKYKNSLMNDWHKDP